MATITAPRGPVLGLFWEQTADWCRFVTFFLHVFTSSGSSGFLQSLKETLRSCAKGLASLAGKWSTVESVSTLQLLLIGLGNERNGAADAEDQGKEMIHDSSLCTGFGPHERRSFGCPSPWRVVEKPDPIAESSLFTRSPTSLRPQSQSNMTTATKMVEQYGSCPARCHYGGEKTQRRW